MSNKEAAAHRSGSVGLGLDGTGGRGRIGRAEVLDEPRWHWFPLGRDELLDHRAGASGKHLVRVCPQRLGGVPWVRK